MPKTLPAPTFNLARMRAEGTGLGILAGWGAGSVVLGSVQALSQTGQARAYGQMTAGWGAVNLALAVPGLIRLSRERPEAKTALEVEKDLRRTRKILLINAGLDVLYVAAGLWLNNYGNRQGDPVKADRYRGWGEAITTQGAGLLVFDLGFWAGLRRVRR